ncbi:MAG: hypothetical protein QG609_570 [Patescibacteria group bacterium]|nr:hypothetical protein [Patescibacteria group bacterium]
MESYRTAEEMKSNYEDALIYNGEGKIEGDAVTETAFMTARQFAELTHGSFAQRFYQALLEKTNRVDNPPQLIDTPHFMELREQSSRVVLKDLVEKEGVTQIVELGAGFCSTSVDFLTSQDGLKVNKYIENDFEGKVLDVKQQIVNETLGGIPLSFIPGNVLDQSFWDKVEQNLSEGEHTAIFCQGLLQYLSKEQLGQLLGYAKTILASRGGVFFHEDILKYHPELREDPSFTFITQSLKRITDKKALDELMTQEEATQFYESEGFEVSRVPEQAKFSMDLYSENARKGAEELTKANLKMWLLRPKS